MVEDNPADVRLIREALKEGGISSNLCLARDGVEALEFLRKLGKPIDFDKFIDVVKAIEGFRISIVTLPKGVNR